MELYLKRTQSGLVPLYDSDYEALNKYKIGDEIKAKLSKPRNYQFHKKFMALINMAFQNQEQIENITDFRYIVTMKAGYYRPVETGSGTAYFPQSISFASMDQAEFEEVYSKVLDVIIKILGVTEEDVEMELINFM